MKKRFLHECPPCDCYNCNDPGTPCLNGGQCDAVTGRCKGCPSGFGGGDCSTVLCGGLSGADRPPGDPQQQCVCMDGWTGVNCNVCSDDRSCSGLLPRGSNSTCYSGASVNSRQFKSCVATLPPLYRRLLGGKPCHATTECSKLSDGMLACSVQFWLNYSEQFWCQLSECVEMPRREVGNETITAIGCAKVNCQCYKGRKLCASIPRGLIDLSPMLEKVVGPASLQCTDQGKCHFGERTLNDYFDGGIDLECSQGECMRYSEVPGIIPATQGFALLYALIPIISLSILGTAIYVTFFRDRHHYSAVLNPQDETRKLMESHIPATLAFRDISYKLNGRRPILHSVAGVVYPGEVLAIIGGSGAGKTTCLDILAQKLKRGIMEGKVMVNGHPIQPGEMAQISAFVDQETKLFGTLTVEETLLTSAQLRLPRSMTLAAKLLRVNETMAELGIEHLAHKRIGTAGKRGLSGGEQRRVAIACELVTAPRVLFLDEPTSGLDAHSAFAVVEALVRMVREHNRTVVMTIHQPRSNIFSLFDRLLLLASGRMVFSGPSDEAAAHFANLGYSVPSGFNTADFLIDITMDANLEYSQGRLSDKMSDGGSSASETMSQADESSVELPLLGNLKSLFADSQGDSAVINDELAKRIAYLEDEFVRSEAGHNLFNTLPDADLTAPIEARRHEQRATHSEQFMILMIRHLRNLVRSPMHLFSHYIITVSLAILLSTLFSPLSSDMGGVQNRLGALFFQSAYFAFAGVSVVEGWWGGGGVMRGVFMRERAGACYSLLVYYCSRTALDLVLLWLLPPFIYGLIVYSWIGFYPGLLQFSRYLLVTCTYSATTASLLQLITLISPTQALATMSCTLSLLASLLFGGFLLNKSHLRAPFKYFTLLSPFNYAFEALLVNELTEIVIKDETLVDVEVPGRIVLRQFGFDAEGFWGDWAALMVMMCVLLVIGFAALKVFVKERR